MPTPASRATASRLASEPPALNTVFAASSTRSRLRSASARGLREAGLHEFLAERFSIPNVSSPALERLALDKRRKPPYNNPITPKLPATDFSAAATTGIPAIHGPTTCARCDPIRQ